jgi:hypothetical protein
MISHSLGKLQKQGFTATLFGLMPLAYEDSMKVKMV